MAAIPPLAADQLAAIERAVAQVATGRMTQALAVAAIAAAVTEARLDVTTKERERAEGQRLLARYDEIAARIGHRAAAMRTAKEFGRPHEWETIADRIRRLRAKRANAGH